ncbi:MAG: hypothetical protein QOG52_1251 [Frankiaceae bacterium]|jgi:hypothetical protein|nr:hypothetical protein [Frankiaceae bacterium]MDQ1715899.1 hypothetical protein [Frankiaceae bacterium]MDQ1724223.1 hypothetical protein [Frankiaceae bacterium]
MRKMTLLVGLATGYVLGTKAGRERYEQIRAKWQAAWDNPLIQEKAGVVQSKATEVYESAKSTVTDKIGIKDNGSPSGVSPYPAYAGADDSSSSPS